jgi:1-acyl-sn-glycerol-3-phosphate acyltransferase
VLLLRSLLFNLVFHLNLAVLMVIALPTLLLPRRFVVGMTKRWGRTSLWLLRAICGIEVEWRGLDRIPPGPMLVAAKHQSSWETFALLVALPDPIFVIKRELIWVPLFGWLSRRAGMIPIDRNAARPAFRAMITQTRAALAEGRQIIVFPEGTRRAAGAPPDYKSGIAHLYAGVGAACLPMALNSGLFWPRRQMMRYPGKILVEFLDPIAPGLRRDVFLGRLEETIEGATTRLVAEGRRDLAARGLKIAVEPAVD